MGFPLLGIGTGDRLLVDASLCRRHDKCLSKIFCISRPGHFEGSQKVQPSTHSLASPEEFAFPVSRTSHMACLVF